MTLDLVRTLRDVRGGLGTRLLAAALVAIIMPLALLADLVRHVRREALVAQVAALDSTRCPRGHRVELISAGWSCAACGSSAPGHGFLPCPACGAIAARAECPCGLSCPNPLFRGTR